MLELTQALSSSLEFRNILFTVVRRIAEVAHVDRCSIVLVRDQGDVGYVVAASDDRELHDLPIRIGNYPEIQRVMRSGEVLVIQDASTHPLFDIGRSGLPANAFRSLALLPIVFEERPMGVLFLRGRQPAALPERELSLARTVANATAIALRNARILQSMRDQTQQISFARFEAERRLKTLQRYADFFHSTADGIVVIDADGQVLFSNPRAHEITGRARDELAEGTFADLFEEKDRRRLEEIRAGFSDGVYPHMVDLEMNRAATARPSEGPRILSVSFGRVPSEDSAILVSFREVTADRAMAAELIKTRDFLERVIESSCGRCHLRGHDWEDSPLQSRCRTVDRLRCPGRRRIHERERPVSARRRRTDYAADFFAGARRPGASGELPSGLRAKDGSPVPSLLSAALIMEDGQPVGSVGVYSDLRERLTMEAKLLATQEELRAREKQALIAELAGAAAHELNQPLTSILGYAELIRRRAPESNAISDAAGIIVREAERMANMVRKIGTITRYETKAYVGGAKILDLDRASEVDAMRKPGEDEW